MLRELWYFCSGSQAAQFESGWSQEQAARRLGKDTDPWDLSPRERAVGKVSVERVKLWRRRSYWRSSGYGAVFKGRFEQRAGRTVLAGRFTGARFAQAGMGLWSIFFGWVAWSGWVEWTRNPGTSALFAIAPTVMAALSLAMMVIVAKEARDNIAWLSDHIRSRLQG